MDMNLITFCWSVQLRCVYMFWFSANSYTNKNNNDNNNVDDDDDDGKITNNGS